jgi:SAM-dependent methyltransferase
MKENYAQFILEETKKGYDQIAEDFSKTRNRPLEQLGGLFDDYLQKKDKVLDLGCGNGRYAESFLAKKVDYVGMDESRLLIEIAKKKYPKEQFIVGSALDLPFPGGDFDKVFSLAVLHHIPSRALRQKFFAEIFRVLRPDGVMILTVWDLRLNKMLASRNWKRMAGFLKERVRVLVGRSRLDAGDFFIPWRGDYRRFVHGFSIKELHGLALGAGFKIIKTGISGEGSREGNLYIAAQKLQNQS